MAKPSLKMLSSYVPAELWTREKTHPSLYLRPRCLALHPPPLSGSCLLLLPSRWPVEVCLEGCVGPAPQGLDINRLWKVHSSVLWPKPLGISLISGWHKLESYTREESTKKRSETAGGGELPLWDLLITQLPSGHGPSGGWLLLVHSVKTVKVIHFLSTFTSQDHLPHPPQFLKLEERNEWFISIKVAGYNMFSRM